LNYARECRLLRFWLFILGSGKESASD